MKEILLRIGSMDYEPSPIVKKHTLDQRYIDVMNCQYLKETRENLSLADNLMALLRKGHTLSVDDRSHLSHVKQVFSFNLTQARDFFLQC